MAEFVNDYANPPRHSIQRNTNSRLGNLESIQPISPSREDIRHQNDTHSYNMKTLDQLKAEEIISGNSDARNHMIIERILNEITGSGNVAHDNSHLTERGDSAVI